MHQFSSALAINYSDGQYPTVNRRQIDTRVTANNEPSPMSCVFITTEHSAMSLDFICHRYSRVWEELDKGRKDDVMSGTRRVVHFIQ